MAERAEEPEAATEQALDQASPAAVALALGRTSKGGRALDAKAASFLDEQTTLIRLQTEHLHEQRELQTSRLRLGRWKDRISLTLQAMTVAVGLAIALVLAAMMWRAHANRGVAIEAFSVPPDLAQRGLTGQVVATEVLDRLSDLQTQTVTTRPASTYANDWGGDIKVEIPETGVSVGEMNRYLREWLGSETRITGEVVRTPTGLAVTARAGAATGSRFEGSEADFEKLVGQAAEAIYAKTQPYRWAVYLASHGRRGEALAAYQKLASSGPAEDQAWAYAGWASMLLQDGRIRDAASKAEAAIRLNPRLYPAILILGDALDTLGRTEDELAAGRQALARFNNGGLVGVSNTGAARRFAQAVEAYQLGDFHGAADLVHSQAGAPIDFEGQAQAYDPVIFLGAVLALDHDVSASRRATKGIKDPGDYLFLQPAALDDWAAAASFVAAARDAPIPADMRSTTFARYAAIVYAHLGHFAEAEAMLALSPMDCDQCLMSRGEVAALKHDWSSTDRWYAEAARQAPSSPFPHTGWGQALLTKGDADGAIAKLEEAHRLGPRYADPLELWGEALMKKRDYAGAIAKFAEADKNAPRWGRNHLRWGEALMLSGRYGEARAEYEAANGLDLSRPDRAALTVFLDRTAKGPLHG